MNYRNDKYENPISILGFGCMRFTQNMGKIDYQKAEHEIMTAYENGVNYYDTAYVYPGSEVLLGRVLEANGIRSKVNIATKLPHYLLKNMETTEKLFQEQLHRLRTDYIDYYLMHMLSDIETWEKLCRLGIREWIEEKKRTGAIRQIGFSFHGNTENFCKIVDAYPWDFCQIQYNYMDEHTQAGRKGLQYANSKGLPVIIMEPLRGGKLVNLLPEEAKKLFGAYHKQYTPAQWAFLWLWDQTEVTCVLSGMNSEAMVLENISTASNAQTGCLDGQDQALLRQVTAAINQNVKVPCTACGYCTPCPAGVDIPGTFSAYNHIYSENRRSAKHEYLQCTAFRKTSTAASNCIGCGKCEKHCPQGIAIRKHLKDAQKELEDPAYKLIRKAIEIFKIF